MLAFLFCSGLLHPGTTLAQPKPAVNTAHSDSLPTHRPLIDVLITLNHTRGVYFLFSQQFLARVLVNNPALTPETSIEKTLSQVLKNTGLHFKKVDELTFVILPRRGADKHATLDPTGVTPEATDPSDSIGRVGEEALRDAPGQLRGRVVATDGKALQGVSVTVRGTRRGTSSDLAGAFTIPADKTDSLVFSFVGYKGTQLPAAAIARSPVILQPSDQPLTEVLVTALGIQKQERSLGYSAAGLDGALFTQSRDINLGNALTGLVAGLNVAGNATGPFGSSRVLIRGNASLSGNNQPLYVVDGIPYDNTTQSFAGQYGGADLGDGLSNISPDNIESVLILKGVAASALYGYRGGNGAILITTRSGNKTHGFGVQVNNNFTLNSVIDERNYQYTYGQGVAGLKPTSAATALAAPYYSWGARLDGSSATNYLGVTYPYLPAKNNFQHFFQTGLTNQSSLGLTGANTRGHFRLGLSHLALGAVVPNSSMRQQGINFNSTYAVTNKLQMELSAVYTFEHVDNRASLSDDPGNVIAPPLYLANSFDVRWMKSHTVHPDGTEWLPGTTDPYFENPYYIAYDYSNTTDRNRITGGLTLKYDLLDWLYVKGQVTRDGYTFDLTNIVPSGVPYTRSDGIHGGNFTQYQVDFHEVNANFMFGLHKKAGPHFTFDANAGGNRQDNYNFIDGVGAVPNSPNRAAGPFLVAGNYNANNIINKPYSASTRRYRVNSLYGSADIGFNNYLFLNLSARNDWFSTLNINTDQYLYPSVSGGFLFSEAWKLPSWISFGKLKASYAASSNGTEPYQNTLTYGIQSYSINGQPLGYISTTDLLPLIPNASLRPISIAEKELGLVLQFFGNRLGADLTLYDKRTKDDIVKITVSSTSGYSQYIENVGTMRNRGIEGLFTGTPIKSSSLTWNVSFNIAVNNNKILSIGGPHSIVINGAYPRWGSEVSISNVVGLPYGQIMGYAYKKDAQGHRIFSDGISSPAPAGEPEQSGIQPLGSTVYKQSGGLSNELHYKNFSLSVLLDFRYGAKIYSGTNLLLYYYGLQKATLAGREGGYTGRGVQENGLPNKITLPAQQYFQDISAGGADHIAEEFVYDASFIKLRSASLLYNFPPALFRKHFIKGINVSFVGRNLAILMKHVPNIDPESSINNTNGQGLELSGYPAVRSWGVNMNVKF